MKMKRYLFGLGLTLSTLTLSSCGCKWYNVTEMYEEATINLEYNKECADISYYIYKENVSRLPKLGERIYFIVDEKEGYKLESLKFNNNPIVENQPVTIRDLNNTLTATFLAPSPAKISLDFDSTKGKVELLDDKNLPYDEKSCLTGKGYKVKVTPLAGYTLSEIKLNNNTIFNDQIFIVKEVQNIIKVTFDQIVNTPTSQTLEQPTTTYLDVEYSIGQASLPSVGNPKLLVIPVQFKDYSPFTGKQLDAIKASFAGSNIDGTNSYWESVDSFYKKSSYGKLDFDIEFSDTYIPTMTGNNFKMFERQSDGGGTYKLLDEFKNVGKINGQKIDYTQLDSNKDGYVDGVWFIYNANDRTEVFGNQHFWAYSFNDYRDTSLPNVKDPVFSKYANCSQIFLYEGSSSGHDAHTLIHETGHMLGLDDYYSYDNLQNPYSALGGLDMMDLNIGDHNSFSKYSLGWLTPTLVTGNAKVSIKPFSSSGNCVILSNKQINSAFNEYIIIEYYTPTDLFARDANDRYTTHYPRFSLESGIRIYHVDARLINGNNNFEKDNISFNAPNPFPTNSTVAMVGASNTASYTHNKIASSSDMNKALGKYSLLETITQQNVRTYNFMGLDESFHGLFKQNDVFNNKKQSNFFINGNMHDAQVFNFEVTIESINENEAILNIKKGA